MAMLQYLDEHPTMVPKDLKRIVSTATKAYHSVQRL